MATSALAKAGTGDVLAGMLTGFVAQGLEIYSAACLASLAAARGRGLWRQRWLAARLPYWRVMVIEAIPQVIKQIGG